MLALKSHRCSSKELEKCVKEKIQSIFTAHLDNHCWPFGATMKAFLLPGKRQYKQPLSEEKRKKESTGKLARGQCPPPEADLPVCVEVSEGPKDSV